ncbi:N(6)-hydroxylysine O-acetyltransferase [Madurella mycetomatis]|uniref:N(6)-hydroxylysine O-acetyltransferase n=1 Tax=Madurella mycetomatis TaxID=100816 RepID=A0A175W7R5_9PEZI|nr:N(6)-hydroxylysine O-acetyltransferase [Madurella mycetomatis]
MAAPTQPPRQFANYAASRETILKLPHPYQTAYLVKKADDGTNSYQLTPRDAGVNTKPLPKHLHNTSLYFSEPQDLKSSDRPKDSNNTPWGRARRSPSVTVSWQSEQPPTIGQLWLITYAVFTVRPSEEAFRLETYGFGADRLAQQLKTVGLAMEHPTSASKDAKATKELLVSRGAFWQGAGSPFGSRPAWVPEEQDPDLSAYPLPPPEYVMTNEASTALCWHPRRRAKPAPGSVIYSRYIPHLRETFSMVALDYADKEQLELFHVWQNDPRVSQGWNETGTLEQHREYLRRAHEDPHQITILARFDETFFAYFEVYWAKEDRIRCVLLGGRPNDPGPGTAWWATVRFRGPHPRNGKMFAHG